MNKINEKVVEKWGDDYSVCPWCGEVSDGVIEVYWCLDRFNRKEKVGYVFYFGIKDRELWQDEYVRMGNRKPGFYCVKCKKRIVLPDEIKKLFE
jgi:hypothetical protein